MALLQEHDWRRKYVLKATAYTVVRVTVHLSSIVMESC